MLRIYEEFSCPGSMSRSVVHIIRAATYDEQGLETDLWETNYAPLRKRAENAASPKGTAPAPDSTAIQAISVLPERQKP
jgi:hypothetical protein